jgi:dinuclear metal center YbgI/SA1388 family protein
MVKLSELISSMELLWPPARAEDWDAPGLVCGDPQRQIARVLLSVDVTSELIGEAIGNFDLVIAHHPFLMRGVTSISEEKGKGSVIASAIRSDVAIFAAHTNADITQTGVSASLAESLGVLDAVALVPVEGESIGHGRIGSLQRPMPLGEFARLIAKTLPASASGVRVAGDYSKMIQRVAVCGGAGDSFITAATEAGAEVYVTADLRHHVVQEARESAILTPNQMALIDVSHWASEWPWLEVAARELRKLHPHITFEVSDLRTDPFDFVITQ